MLGEFFEWWGRQLLDLVPERLRQRADSGNALVVDAGNPGVLSLLARRRGAEGLLAQLRLDEPGYGGLRAAVATRPRGEKVFLRLPRDAVLERRVSLPLAAERDPERVLGYELERLTPFSGDEVFWGFGIEERDKARGRLGLRLTVVPRAAVQGLIDLLAGVDARPELLEAVLPDGVRTIRLTHDSGAGGAERLSRLALMAAAAALLLIALASPFLRQSLALAALDDRLDAAAPRMQLVENLRKRILGAGAGGDAVAAETIRLGDTLEALAAVTEILPDDSYLTEFTMRERKMTLSGLSGSAPKLISGLSSDPRIRNPAFTAPVTRSETSKSDVFAIRAELAP